MIAGFTFHAMLSYYIINSFLAQLDKSDGIANEISDKIRGGTFSKHMVIPVNIQGYFLAQTLGASAFYFLFNLFAALVWIFIFRIKFVFTANPFMFLSAILIAGMGLIFMLQFNYFLGLLTFIFQDIYLFLMIKSTILLLVTGNMIPLVLLPKTIVDILRALPFYYISYLPSMLMMGRNGEEAGYGIIILAAWIGVFLMVNRFAYNRLRIKYDGVGI
jgi:ABC-2 type transport system permease protein